MDSVESRNIRIVRSSSETGKPESSYLVCW